MNLPYAYLRYFLGGGRPSQTTTHTLSSKVSINRIKRWFFKFCLDANICIAESLLLSQKKIEHILNYHLAYILRLSPLSMVAVKVPGTFRPVLTNLHLHKYFNFTGIILETVGESLHHSCRSELTRQGISLP